MTQPTELDLISSYNSSIRHCRSRHISFPLASPYREVPPLFHRLPTALHLLGEDSELRTELSWGRNVHRPGCTGKGRDRHWRMTISRRLSANSVCIFNAYLEFKFLKKLSSFLRQLKYLVLLVSSFGLNSFRLSREWKCKPTAWNEVIFSRPSTCLTPSSHVDTKKPQEQIISWTARSEEGTKENISVEGAIYTAASCPSRLLVTSATTAAVCCALTAVHDSSQPSTQSQVEHSSQALRSIVSACSADHYLPRGNG